LCHCGQRCHWNHHSWHLRSWYCMALLPLFNTIAASFTHAISQGQSWGLTPTMLLFADRRLVCFMPSKSPFPFK
jgi:hypothetical protein